MKYIIGTVVLIGIMLAAFRNLKKEKEIKPATFNHMALYVSDLAKSSAFYKQVFLLQKIDEPFKDGRHDWYRVGEHSQLHLIGGNKQPQPQIKDTHLAFSVQSLDDVIQRLQKANIPYTNWAGDGKEPTLRSDKVKQIYLQDPDGYWLEINDDRY